MPRRRVGESAGGVLQGTPQMGVFQQPEREVGEMARHGLLIDYEYCTGCHTCEVACKQEHNYPVGKWGIKVNEIILETFEKIAIDYIPFPTDLCNLCGERTKEGIPPACVKHCQAGCMMYGPVKELAKVMDKKPKTVLFAPR